ncbi:MAG: carbohydrate kinase family protein [Turicibacter sp.]
MKKVLIIGGTTYDTIVNLNELPQPLSQTLFAGHHETMGSTGAGKALAMTKLGIPCQLHSILGDDPYGEVIKKSLADGQVDFVYDIDPAGTERHINLMDPFGERISIFITASSSDLPLDLVRLEKMIASSDLVVLNIIGYTKQLLTLLKKYNKPVWTDLHDYQVGNPYYDEFIEMAQVIFLSSDNLEDYKNQMKSWIAANKELVVCTHGKGGATALTNEGIWYEMPIITDYPFVDANGAGDNFFSGYLYGYLNNKNVEDCLKYATITGGLCITSPELSSNELSEEKLQSDYMKYFD